MPPSDTPLSFILPLPLLPPPAFVFPRARDTPLQHMHLRVLEKQTDMITFVVRLLAPARGQKAPKREHHP